MQTYDKEAACPDRKRQFYQNSAYSAYAKVDSIVFKWFSKMRSLNIPVSGPMIQTMALGVAKALNQPEFKASGGWLSRFKGRHTITGIRGKKIRGEKSAMSQQVTIDNWHERLTVILKRYGPRDIFNMDETSVFYRALPDKTLAVKGSDVAGVQKSKERLTASLCVNQLGEFEKVLVIGTSLQPRCFRNLDLDPGRLPVVWRSNRQAWMTTGLFEEWVSDFNRRMSREGRQVVLLLDSAPPHHPRDPNLSNVRLVFLPSDAPSCLQPLNQGIVQAVKLHYRRRLLQHVIVKAESDPDPQAVCRSVDEHLAVTWIQAAVRDVKVSTVQKCFKRTGIPALPLDRLGAGPPADLMKDDDDDTPLVELAADLAELLRQTTSALNLPEPMSAEEYAAVDDSCPAHDTLDDGWESRLIEEAVAAPAEPEPDSDAEVQSVPSKKLTDVEAENMLETLGVHFLQNNYSQTLDLLMMTQQQFHEEKLKKCTSQFTMDWCVKVKRECM